MNLMRAAWIVLLCLLLGGGSTGCKQLQQKSLEGRWRSTTSGSTMEFYPDHTAQVSLGPLKLAGKYSVLDNDRLKVEVTTLGITTVRTWKMQFEGDTLKITDESGAQDSLVREPQK